MNAAPPHLVGRASATINQVRQVSASFGVAILTTIMQNRQVFHVTNLGEAVNMSGNAGLALKTSLPGLAYQLGLPANVSQALGLGLIYYRLELLSTIQAIDDVFIIAAAMCVLGFILSFFLLDDAKKRRLATAQQPNQPHRRASPLRCSRIGCQRLFLRFEVPHFFRGNNFAINHFSALSRSHVPNF